jgi:crossover junction endodeoxyribonuclease RusA
MTDRLAVNVIGTPAPQGSKRHVGHGVLVESSAAVRPWRDAVAYAVHHHATACGWDTITGPAAVTVDFYLRRPSSAPRRVTRPYRKPDLDKLLRATLDALVTAGAVADDARIVQITAAKHFAEGGHATGARIIIEAAP